MEEEVAKPIESETKLSDNSPEAIQARRAARDAYMDTFEGTMAGVTDRAAKINDEKAAQEKAKVEAQPNEVIEGRLGWLKVQLKRFIK